MNPDSTQLLIGIGLFELIRENVCIYIYIILHANVNLLVRVLVRIGSPQLQYI